MVAHACCKTVWELGMRLVSVFLVLWHVCNCLSKAELWNLRSQRAHDLGCGWGHSSHIASLPLSDCSLSLKRVHGLPYLRSVTGLWDVLRKFNWNPTHQYYIDNSLCKTQIATHIFMPEQKLYPYTSNWHQDNVMDIQFKFACWGECGCWIYHTV